MSALTRRIPRPSVSMIVAFVALFAALGGTSYAALKITGKNVENSSLTGVDIENKSLGAKEHKPNSLGGDQIKESTLGAVPEAVHAANADSAVNAQTSAKALDADKIGGLAPTDLMLSKPRTYETNIGAQNNFPNGSTLAAITDVPGGTYLVIARLSYNNPGGAGTESCTLVVPGANDSASFTVGAGETEALSLQEVVTSNSVFMPSVNCSSDGTDDVSSGSIIALRVD